MRFPFPGLFLLRGKSSFLVPAAWMLPSLFLFWIVLVPSAEAQSARTASVSSPAPFQQVIYAPFAGLEEFGKWEVEVANRGNRKIPATVTVYGADGEVVASATVALAADEVQRIDIRNFVAKHGTKDAERSSDSRLAGISGTQRMRFTEDAHLKVAATGADSKDSVIYRWGAGAGFLQPMRGGRRSRSGEVSGDLTGDRTAVDAGERERLGGIAVESTAQTRAVAAQVTLSGYRFMRDRKAIDPTHDRKAMDGFGNMDAILIGNVAFQSNVSDAVWWEPEGGRSFLILGNASGDAMEAELTFGSGGKQTVHLAPHATVVRAPNDSGGLQVQPAPGSVRDDNGRAVAGIQSVHVVGNGKAGALRVSGYTVAERDGFVNVIRAYDPAGSSEAAVYANGLHFSGAASHLVVKNLTQSPVNVWGTIYPLGADAVMKDVSARMPEGPASQTVAMAPKTLQPGGVGNWICRARMRLLMGRR